MHTAIIRSDIKVIDKDISLLNLISFPQEWVYHFFYLFNLIVVGVYTLNLHHYELKTTYPRRVEVPLLKVLGCIVTQVHK